MPRLFTFMPIIIVCIFVFEKCVTPRACIVVNDFNEKTKRFQNIEIVTLISSLSAKNTLN